MRLLSALSLFVALPLVACGGATEEGMTSDVSSQQTELSSEEGSFIAELSSSDVSFEQAEPYPEEGEEPEASACVCGDGFYCMNSKQLGYCVTNVYGNCYCQVQNCSNGCQYTTCGNNDYCK